MKEGAAQIMNTRQSEILKALYRADEYITLAEMAEQMQVSVKTVRNDIASIREYLSEQGVGEIETKPHAGIRLIMNEEEWRSLGGGDDIKKTEYNTSPFKKQKPDGTETGTARLYRQKPAGKNA